MIIEQYSGLEEGFYERVEFLQTENHFLNIEQETIEKYYLSHKDEYKHLLDEKEKDEEDEDEDEDEEEELSEEIEEQIRDNLLNCCMLSYFFIPQKFCIDTALKVHLIPVTLETDDEHGYEQKQALSFWGYNYDQSHKLDVYQLLVNNTYDSNREFFKDCLYNIERLKNYYRENDKLYNELLELLTKIKQQKQ